MQQLMQQLPPRGRHITRRAYWYRRHRHQLRYFGIGLIVCIALLEVVQVLYPANRTLPLVRAGGQLVGGRSSDDAAKLLADKYDHASLMVKTESKTFSKSLHDVGAQVATDQAAKRAADYPWWQRVVPLSSVIIMITRDTPVHATYNDAQLLAFAQEVQQQGAVAPVNAGLTSKRGKIKLVPAKPGKEYLADKVAAELKRAPVSLDSAYTLTPTLTTAALTDAQVEGVLGDAQAMADSRLALTVNGKEKGVKRQDVGSWLAVQEGPAGGKPQIVLNAEVVKKYLTDKIQPDIYIAPGTTHVQLIDDREVGRTPAQSGRGVDMDKTVVAISSAITALGDSTVDVALADIPPVPTYDKKYSNTDKELASLLSGIAAAKGGYGISLMELDDRSANANGNRQFVAASTYKLYVAYAVIEEVKAGRMSWSDTMSDGRSAAKCFDDMIVISDNSCPIAFGNRIGWSKVNDLIHSIGISNATHLHPTMYTTPNDLAYFLYRVQNGSIMSGADRDRLIDAMKRQHYTRAGIPAGTGATVADKVGDVDGYLHDAAIVYSSNKTYVLVIMTYSSSWTGIADAAHQIHMHINR